MTERERQRNRRHDGPRLRHRDRKEERGGKKDMVIYGIEALKKGKGEW